MPLQSLPMVRIVWRRLALHRSRLPLLLAMLPLSLLSAACGEARTTDPLETRAPAAGATMGAGAEASEALRSDAPSGDARTEAQAGATGEGQAPTALPSTAALLTPVEQAAGLDFRHVNGAGGSKFMVETLGAGGGIFDYDNDGDQDLFLVQGGPLPGSADPTPLTDRLYRNEGGMRFSDVTAEAEISATSYGMGVCFGDVDNDGFEDIHLANFGQDQLWRNEGDGRFREIGQEAGIDNPAWSSGCAFADYDRDGWLDLFVVNYVDFGLDNHKACGPPERPMYCHPDVYNGVPDVLYRNLGNGRFENVTAAAGVLDDDPTQGKGLGVSWFDHDNDGWIDLYVANDSTRQFLYVNQGDGTFIESGVLRGVAFNARGKTEAGMGVAIGDADGDGRLDLYMTTLDVETNTLLRNGEGDFFEDVTSRSGAGDDPQNRVGFGTQMLDIEQDGDLDIYVTNGHIIDNIDMVDPRLSFEQVDQLYENDGEGRFRDVSDQAGPAFERAGVGRSATTGDLDGDGDLDLLISHNDRPAALLRTDSQHRGRALLLDLRSRHGGRPAIGARVEVRMGDRLWVREVSAGGSYQGQSATVLHFGLGEGQGDPEVEIRWPEGATQAIQASSLVFDAPMTITQGDAP